MATGRREEGRRAYIPRDERNCPPCGRRPLRDRMLQYMKEWKAAGDGRPFFAYFPFSAPHWPLQAPKEFIHHYRGIYDEGPEALRQRRLSSLVKLGMIDPDTKAHPVVADEVSGWYEMTPEEQKLSCRAMEGRTF